MAEPAGDFTRLGEGFGLAEAPAWDPSGGRILVADPRDGGVWALPQPGRRDLVIPHRRGIGGMGLHAAGGLVVSGRNVCWKRPDGGADVLCDLDPSWGLTRFNDLGTDAAGRVYVGSLEWADGGMDDPRPGYLHVVEPAGSRPVDDGIGTANGIAISPDDSVLYVVDSRAATLLAYDHAADGSLAGRRTLASWPGVVVDGIAVAQSGNIWVALGEPADQIAVIDPAGDQLARIDVPEKHVTSVCFGGADLRLLHVTTATAVLTLPVSEPGLPVPLARV